MTKRNIRKYFGFPLDRECREAVDRELAAYLFKAGAIVCAIILISQVLMMLTMGLRPGGPFLHSRRTGYFILYMTYFVVTLVSLLLGIWFRRCKNDNNAAFINLSVVYVGFVCMWSCGITLLDQLGGGGLNVYTSMILSVAAFAVLRPWQAMLIFGASGLLLNFLLPYFQKDSSDVFSNIVNTFFSIVLAVLIAFLLYRMRVFNSHDRTVIRQQYEEIEQINKKLNHQVITDELTGMNNRRYLEQNIAGKLERYRQSGRKTAGMMLDIDYFKRFNDQYGHLAGDRCLRDIAEIILCFADTEEACAVRYGGEEFFLCMFNCEEQAALQKAEELRRRIEEQNNSDEFHITVSIGVYAGCVLLDNLVEHADQALYQAKRQGRNTVVAYSQMHER